MKLPYWLISSAISRIREKIEISALVLRFGVTKQRLFRWSCNLVFIFIHFNSYSLFLSFCCIVISNNLNILVSLNRSSVKISLQNSLDEARNFRPTFQLFSCRFFFLLGHDFKYLTKDGKQREM